MTIVERLRASTRDRICQEAADEIERLRAALEMSVSYGTHTIKDRVIVAALAGADVRDRATLEAIALGKWVQPCRG